MTDQVRRQISFGFRWPGVTLVIHFGFSSGDVTREWILTVVYFMKRRGAPARAAGTSRASNLELVIPSSSSCQTHILFNSRQL